LSRLGFWLADGDTILDVFITLLLSNRMSPHFPSRGPYYTHLTPASRLSALVTQYHRNPFLL